MNRFIESLIFHILCTLTDLVVLNLLYVLCCIPVVTIGAATTALYGTVLALLHDEGHLYTLFVRIFLKRFKQTTVFWLLWLTAVAVAAADLIIVGLFWNHAGKPAAVGLLVLTLFLLLSTGSWLFPLLVTGGKCKAKLFTAFALSMQQLPRTLLVCVINVLPAALVLCWTYGFLLLFWVYLVIGFALSAYVNCLLLKKALIPHLSQEVSQ